MVIQGYFEKNKQEPEDHYRSPEYNKYFRLKLDF